MFKGITSTFGKIDAEFNATYQLLDSRNSGLETSFSSEELVESLVRCGVPLHFALRTLESVRRDVFRDHRSSDLTTAELRRYVREALHRLVDDGATPQDVQHWGDRYVRKYGPADGKIQIIHETGRYDELDYKYLKSVVLPDVFGTMFKMPENKVKELLGGDALVHMSNQIMTAVRDLGVYRVNYRTLEALIQEIALQPPHPWFAANGPGFDPVIYNLEHARSQLEHLVGAIQYRNVPGARDAFRETVHHACAAILAYYGESIGATDLQPFFNLHHVVRLMLGKKERLAIEGSTIDAALATDLQLMNMTVADFNDFLKRIDRLVNTLYVEERVLGSSTAMQRLTEIASGLVHGRGDLIDQIRTATSLSRGEKGKSFEDLVARVLALNPHFRVHRDRIVEGRQYDLILEHFAPHGSIFDDVKRFIQVECKNLKGKTDREVIEKAGKRADDMNADLWCNTVLVISANGFTRDAVQETSAWFRKGVLVLLLDSESLSAMVEQGVAPYLEDRIRARFVGDGATTVARKRAAPRRSG